MILAAREPSHIWGRPSSDHPSFTASPQSWDAALAARMALWTPSVPLFPEAQSFLRVCVGDFTQSRALGKAQAAILGQLSLT